MNREREPLPATIMGAVTHQGNMIIRERSLPRPGDHQLLVRTEYSAISSGTESMVLRGSNDGIRLGYNSCGIVVERGDGANDFEIGQRIACYGIETHAQYHLVSKYLAAPLPDHVDGEEAAFIGLGTIAIHALRQADLRFGETVVICGLGMLGQIAAQVAHAAAFRVIAFDRLAERCRMLTEIVPDVTVCSSAEEVASTLAGAQWQADSVLLCAGGGGDDLLDQGIGWLRDRGNIVIVGVPNTSFQRSSLFRKEAQIRISRAGGPGRYDTGYEVDGYDYPIGYVRWTEGRNVQEFVRLLASGRISLRPLIRHRFPFQDISEAYRLCLDSPEETMGMIIQY